MAQIDTSPRQRWSLKTLAHLAIAAVIIMPAAWLLDHIALQGGIQVILLSWVMAAFAFVGAMRRDRNERDSWAEPVWNFIASAIFLIMGLFLTLRA